MPSPNFMPIVTGSKKKVTINLLKSKMLLSSLTKDCLNWKNKNMYNNFQLNLEH